MSARVRHDHLPNPVRRGDPTDSGLIHGGIEVDKWLGRRKRREKQMRKRKLDEALYLISSCGVPVHLAAKRVGLTYGFLKRVSKHAGALPEDPFKRVNTRPRFGKLHGRAREVIKNLMSDTMHPLCLRDFQRELQARCCLKVSRPWIAKFLREEMQSTYRKLKPIRAIQNEPNAKLQRQYAACKYIEALHEGKRIINIDESVIRFTDHRIHGWMRKD